MTRYILFCVFSMEFDVSNFVRNFVYYNLIKIEIVKLFKNCFGN